MGELPHTPEMKLTFFTLLAGIALALAGNDNAIERLLDDLLEDTEYDKFAIPMEHGPHKETGENALNVAVGIGPRNMEMDLMGNMKMNAWPKSMWTDFRLSWSPEQYDGVDRIMLPADMVWRPDLTIYNQFDYAAGGPDQSIMSSPYQVVVTNTGTVIWIPAIKMYVDCSREGFVPLGSGEPGPHDCHIKLGSWVHDARHINLTTFSGNGQLSMDDMSRNSPWVVESQEPDSIKYTTYDCCPEPYMVADYRFKLKKAFEIRDDGKKIFDISAKEIDENVMKNKGKDDINWTTEN